MKKILLILSIILLVIFNSIYSQQLADTKYNPTVNNPAYEQNKGPVIFIDEGHNNFHTLSGRYQAFGKLLQKDGYLLKPFSNKFIEKEFAKGKILVFSNALNKRNIEDWSLPLPLRSLKKKLKQLTSG